MGTIADAVSAAWRDYVTDGVPATGEHEPIKTEIRAIGPLIETAIANAGLGALVSVVYATRAELDADLVHDAGAVGLVYADATDANNDLYIKVGASGAGSWTLTTALHGGIAGLAQPYVDAAQAAQAAAEAAASVIVTDTFDGLRFRDDTTQQVVGGYWDGAWHLPGYQRVVPETVPDVLAEVVYIPSYGQSLAIGSEAVSAISTAQPYDSIMFNGGVRWPSGAESVADDHASLQTLVESVDGSFGETPISGAFECMIQLIADEDGIAFGDNGFQLLGAAIGQGGNAIANFQADASAGYYQRFVDDLGYGLTLTRAATKSLSCPAVLWTQDAADINAGNSQSYYHQALLKLLASLTVTRDAELGVFDEPVRLIGSQGASYTYYSKTTRHPALAKLAAHREKVGYYCTGPDYHLARAADGIHLTAASYKALGAMAGLALKRLLWDRVDFDPLLITRVQPHDGGRIIIAETNAAVGQPLVEDTTAVSSVANLGATLVDAAGAPVTISSAAVLGHNRIKIVPASPTTAGALRFGFNGTSGSAAGPVTGARTNIRTSGGATFDPLGIDYDLNHWLPICEEQF